MGLLEGLLSPSSFLSSSVPTGGQITLKRAFDIVGATVGLLLFSPLFLSMALLITRDGGPLFYRGARVGLQGKRFAIYKFRTMVVNAEQLGASSTSDDDPRITRLGSWLRRYKLDEFPQLINVLSGEMSLVGPRPQVQWAVDLYTPEERVLLNVFPGITDYASLVFRNEGELLRGSKDPDKDYLQKIAPAKTRLGLSYIQTRSFWIDMKIVMATMLAALGVNPAWCLPVAVHKTTEMNKALNKGVVDGTLSNG
jgi:lipopolysaccharide/colanic/teichoic acid biosynthesis glycosyltransferase